MNYSIDIAETEPLKFEVNSLYAALMKVTDYRHGRGKRYSLATLLTVSILAKLSGEDTAEGIADWVKLRKEEGCQYLGLERGTLPHAVTYRRVLGPSVDLAALEQVVGHFFAGQAAGDTALSIDGKSMRGTIETGKTRGVHLLAVYAGQSGMVLSQADVTVADIERLFATERTWPGSAALRTDFQSVTITTKGHGRLTSHTLTSSSLLNPTTDWPKRAQVFHLKRDVRHIKSGKTTTETSYGVTSLPADLASPRTLIALKRGHWAIENKWHYCRDVTFHEDACRLTIGHAAHTIAILNNLALGWLRLSGFTAIARARRQFDASPKDGLLLILSALP